MWGLVHGGKWCPFSSSPGQRLPQRSLFTAVTHSRLHGESQERTKNAEWSRIARARAIHANALIWKVLIFRDGRKLP